MPKFEPEQFLGLIEHYKITSVNVVPPLMVFLTNHPMVDEYNISSLKYMSYGAAPTGSKIDELWSAPIIQEK